MRPALPVTHFTGRQMREILKTQRAQQKRQRARACQSGNLFITNHCGRKSFQRLSELRYKYCPSAEHRQSHVLFRKSPPVRPELLKIDGRLLEVRVRLNPRARRMIVKVNPVTGEVSVTAPTRRGLSAALDFARGERDWIAGQLAKASGAVALEAGATIPFRGRDHVIAAAARGPAPVWTADDTIWVRGDAAHAPRRVLDFLKREARSAFEARALQYAERLGVKPS